MHSCHTKFSLLLLLPWTCSATRSGLLLQDEKQSEQQRQAELAAFERRNIAMSSDRTTAALVQQGQQDAAGAAKESALQRSGLAIKANADRAKSVQV